MSDYMSALLIGAAVIIVFAWDQFKRPSYEMSQELTRLIELLSPAVLRNRTVYWRAYTFYVGILLLIYLLLCAYGTLLFPALGWDILGMGSADDAAIGASELPAPRANDGELPMTGYHPGAALNNPQQPLTGQATGENAVQSNPLVPLMVSLAIVGLAPSVPILLRVEEKIRFAAHRLSGIPTRLVIGSHELRRTPLELPTGENTYLIPQQDWQRMEHYNQHATKMLDDPGEFEKALLKIFAFKSWIIQNKLPIANNANRHRIVNIEGTIERKIDRLIVDLDALIIFEAPLNDEKTTWTNEQLRAAWEKYAEEAEHVCTDVCVLTMLYVEHGILPTDEYADQALSNGTPENNSQEAFQRHLAQNKLINLLNDAARKADQDSMSFVIWGRSTTAALMVAFIFGTIFATDTVVNDQNMIGGASSLAGTSRIVLGILLFMSAALIYALALFVALSYQQTAYQQGTWRNVFRDNWARWLPQMLTVFFFSAVAAIVSTVGYNLYATINVAGWDVVRSQWQQVLAAAIVYEGPNAMRGPVLAIMVLLITDAWRNGTASLQTLQLLPLVTGGVMLLTGALTQSLSTQAASNAAFDLSVVWAPLLEAGIFTGLIGVSVGYFVRGTLVHSFPSALDRHQHQTSSGDPIQQMPLAEK